MSNSTQIHLLAQPEHLTSLVCAHLTHGYLLPPRDGIINMTYDFEPALRGGVLVMEGQLLFREGKKEADSCHSEWLFCS
jgi:hypothetical protein